MPGGPEPIELQHADGSTTVIHQFNPATEGSAVCIIFPAMGVKASYYRQLAEELATQGITAITVDLRGHGHSSVRPRRSVDFSYTDLLNHEYTSVLNHVGASLADKRIFLFGHSLGGQLSCLFASRNTHRIDGIILSATCSVYYKGWPGLSAYRILLGTQFAGLVASIVGYFPGDKVGFGGKEARSLMRDWSRQARTGRYVLENDPFDYEQTLKTVTIPLLAISYQADTFAPVEAVDHLLDKMPAAEKQHIHLKDSDPRNEGFSHFNWAKRPKNVVTVVSQWINSIP